jgi:hypothetical protein
MKLYIPIVFIFCFLNSFSQSSYENVFSDSLKEISWSCHIVYLPSPQSEYVILKANKNNLSASHQTFKIRKRFKRRLTKRIKLTKNDFTKNHELYNSLNQQYVYFPITERDKDSLRKFLSDTLYNGDKLYKLDSIQLSRYLEKDTIEVDMSVFQMDSINDFLQGVVIDGAPFRFQIMNITPDNDTIINSYQGNLFGGDRYRDLPNYLLYGSLYNETTIFDELPFDEYFSRSNFLRVFLRYMEGKEGLLEFKPFEFFIED